MPLAFPLAPFAAALLASWLAGCGGSAHEAALDESGLPGPGATIAFAEQGTLELGLGETRAVTIVTDPPATYEVTLALLGQSLDATLDHAKVATSADGRATVLLRAPNAPTTFRLRASIKDGPSAEMPVSVSDQGFGSVRVVPVYAGAREVTTWTASVVARTTCATIAPELPGEPEGALVATSDGDSAPVVESAPVGPNLAVALRAGHYVWGCTDATSLLAGSIVDVKVNVVDKPIDLSRTDLDVAFVVDLAPSTYAIPIADATTLFLDAFLPPDTPEPTTLLDAMQALLPDEEAQAFSDKRQFLDFDVQLEQAFGAADMSLRQVAKALVEAGAAEHPLAVTGHLAAIEGSPGHAMLSVSSFAGLDAGEAGVPTSHLVKWAAEPDDRVLFGSTLFWLPTSYLGGAALTAAKAVEPDAVSVADVLATTIGCDVIAKAFGGAGTCGVSCIEALCRGALDARWQLAIGASAAAGRIGTLDIAASAAAKVDDEAAPSSFEGVWLGSVAAGEATAAVSGTASGWSPEAAPAGEAPEQPEQ